MENIQSLTLGASSGPPAWAPPSPRRGAPQQAGSGSFMDWKPRVIGNPTKATVQATSWDSTGGVLPDGSAMNDWQQGDQAWVASEA